MRKNIPRVTQDIWLHTVGNLRMKTMLHDSLLNTEEHKERQRIHTILSKSFILQEVKQYLIKKLFASCIWLDGKFQLSIHRRYSYIDLLKTQKENR